MHVEQRTHLSVGVVTSCTGPGGPADIPQETPTAEAVTVGRLSHRAPQLPFPSGEWPVLADGLWVGLTVSNPRPKQNKEREFSARSLPQW